MIRKMIVAGFALILSLAAPFCVIADDYRWIKNTDRTGNLIEVDPKICKLYEENLRYFAQRNTPMSCYRPIAPHLKDRIKDVEWEDLNPDRYPALFRDVIVQHKNLSNKNEDEIQKNVEYALDDIGKKIRVFRRAKIELFAHLRNNYNLSEKPESYWVLQYGFDDISQSNPRSVYRCVSARAGGQESNLRLYAVADDSGKLIGSLGTTLYPSNEGQYIKQIDNRIFVENISEGWIYLNEVSTKTVLTDTVCNYKFEKSPAVRK